MDEEMYVTPWEVWDTFLNDCQDGDEYLLAEHEGYGVEIYLTREDDRPGFLVYMGSDPIYHEVALRNESDCLYTAKKVFETYLTPKVFAKLAEDDEDLWDLDCAERREMIEMREEELDLSLEYFLNDILCGAGCDKFDVDLSAMIEDGAIKDDILELLARKYGLPIYRPMYLEDERGEEFFEEYPYDFMVFEDE